MVEKKLGYVNGNSDERTTVDRLWIVVCMNQCWIFVAYIYRVLRNRSRNRTGCCGWMLTWRFGVLKALTQESWAVWDKKCPESPTFFLTQKSVCQCFPEHRPLVEGELNIRIFRYVRIRRYAPFIEFCMDMQNKSTVGNRVRSEAIELGVRCSWFPCDGTVAEDGS